MEESSLNIPFSVPTCLELALEGTRGMVAFEPIIIEMRRVAQSGSVSQTGPHSQECGPEALFCFSPFPPLRHAVSPYPQACVLQGDLATAILVCGGSHSGPPLPCPPKPFPPFPSGFGLRYRPAWSQKALCPQAGASPSSFCWNHLSAPPLIHWSQAPEPEPQALPPLSTYTAVGTTFFFWKD